MYVYASEKTETYLVKYSTIFTMFSNFLFGILISIFAKDFLAYNSLPKFLIVSLSYTTLAMPKGTINYMMEGLVL